MHEEWRLDAFAPDDVKRSCLTKTHYTNKTSARDRAATIKKRTGLEISVYRCSVCHEFHLTRTAKEAKPAVKARLRDKKAIDNGKTPC